MGARPFFPQGWRRFRRQIAQANEYVLLLDYDGSLTPIVRDPKKAFLSASMRKLLVDLSRQKGIYIGILSGRSLKEIQKLVGVKGIFYAGNHGLEIVNPLTPPSPPKGERGRVRGKEVFEHARRYQPLIQRLARKLSRQVEKIPGVWVEDKGITLSVHYRCCSAADTAGVLAICQRFTSPWEARRQIWVTRGKKVYEIRPAIEWNKGEAVEFFLKQLPHSTKNRLVAYIGDDTTDEDAFIVVKRRGGLAIRVGGSGQRTKAPYYLYGITQAHRFLTLLSKMETIDGSCGC